MVVLSDLLLSHLAGKRKLEGRARVQEALLVSLSAAESALIEQVRVADARLALPLLAFLSKRFLATKHSAMEQPSEF